MKSWAHQAARLKSNQKLSDFTFNNNLELFFRDLY